MKLIYLDTETTDLKDKRLVQLAYIDSDTGEVFDELFCPPIPISPGASSVSHITNEDISGKPEFKDSKHATDLQKKIDDGGIVVAHNAPFDIGVLRNEGVTVKDHICTQKCSQNFIKDDDIENYSMQYLRYYLGLYKQEEDKHQAHDALGDIMVLKNLYHYIEKFLQDEFDYDEDQAAQELVTVSGKPLLLNKINFGKHRGKKFSEVASRDIGYLRWLYGEKMKDQDDGDVDMIYTLEHYLGI